MRKRGSAGVVALGMMMVVLTASIGIAGLTSGYMFRAKSESRQISAYQVAQGGLEHTTALAFQALNSSTTGVFTSDTKDLSSTLASLASGCKVQTKVEPLSDPGYAWITSTATVGTTTKSVRQLVSTRNVGIWNNAIFAGTGAAGQAINGNVDVRGSVHILGEGEAYSDLNGNGQWDAAETFTDKNNNKVWDPGEVFTDANGDGVWNSAEPYNDTNKNLIYDPPLTQTDLNSSFSGNAYIGNNYSGMPLALEAQVPVLPKINGIEQMGAEVRVKHGRIAIGGSATIGTTAVVDGGTSKGTIDGSYVSDGYTGNKGASGVFSDNGTNNAYDVGNLGIDFPIISGIGADTYVDKAGNSYTTQEDFLNTQSLSFPLNNITESTTAFNYSDGKGNSIKFTPASGSNKAVIEINGIIKVTGNLNLCGSKETILYKGNGTFYTTGDMTIQGNVLPAAGLVFPTTARIGYIAKGNIGLATGSGNAQLSMAGAFYAQGQIISAKQNQIAGTFVANFFDMGTNVPNIYAAPTLPYNMPPGMPGDKLYFTLKVKSWRTRTAAALN